MTDHLIANQTMGEWEEPEDREVRLAKQDIDNPRPQFWEADKARYRAALEARRAKR